MSLQRWNEMAMRRLVATSAAAAHTLSHPQVNKLIDNSHSLSFSFLRSRFAANAVTVTVCSCTHNIGAQTTHNGNICVYECTPNVERVRSGLSRFHGQQAKNQNPKNNNNNSSKSATHLSSRNY